MFFFINIKISHEFQIGDIIQTIGFATYDNTVSIGTIGEIIHIRHRYRNTPNEYFQYRVKFDDYPEMVNYQLNNLFKTNKILKINDKIYNLDE